ncbi:pheophorbide a oxygenase family protein [Striga asiatica]|uniref:Pheophorbide a oxygenase family protein n=1 Tax=Striga asiatica TaxID=4170 RepID=A0A5A7PVT9_STRAF|nr:pheophorbide a oxygenase family protein [Striga asiatica]
MATKAPEHTLKKARFEKTAALETSGSQEETAIRDADHSVKPLSLTINPDYVRKLKASNILGFQRLPAASRSTARYYTLRVDQLRSRFSYILENYLSIKLNEQEEILSFDEVTNKVNAITPIIVNACMTAVYLKLHNIHKSFQTHSTRFATPPSYTEDLELPLPFADAISQLGVFTPSGLTKNIFCVPVYPEGTENEGRSSEIWHNYDYENVMPCLRTLGIKLKSVDTKSEVGSAWWTFRHEHVYGHFDLRCIFSPVNYSDHACLLASMFIPHENPDNDASSLIVFHNDDVPNYPCRLREIPPGFQLRAFSALCHGPREEWLI